jgi:hypothetical protein
MGWFKIRSWHKIKFVSRGGKPRSYCGKWAAQGAVEAVEFPMHEKTCESCLRYSA